MTMTQVEASVSTAPAGTLSSARAEVLSYFALTVLGFSFWFFMAVPFASHRETYWWLAKVSAEKFAYALSFISSTYRPFHQATTWIAFEFLNPSVFPTSVPRQALLQLLVYGVFVLAWWLIFSTAKNRRILALVACIGGAVFFSGYVHLFHVYGLSYVPVILTLGTLLRLWSAGTFRGYEVPFAAATIVLVLWHPFTTALFVSFFFGHYLETFHQRNRKEHIRSLAILVIGALAVGFFVLALPRLWETSTLLVETATRPVGTRLLGFLVSYQTNEVNRIASAVAFLLTQAVVVSLPHGWRVKLAFAVLATVLGAVFMRHSIPLILLWLAAAAAKLLMTRNWSLFFLALTAIVLPFGGGIGTPIHALFALIVGVYATALAWPEADWALDIVGPRYVTAGVLLVLAIAIAIRVGVNIPGLVPVARPLLAERERTYQLETALAWLRTSAYCGYDVGFAEAAGNPIDSVESAITRQYRPPASLSDVRLFWDTVLRCDRVGPNHERATAVVTFGGPPSGGARTVFEVGGRYAGPARVEIKPR